MRKRIFMEQIMHYNSVELTPEEWFYRNIRKLGHRCSCPDNLEEIMSFEGITPFFTIRGKSITPEQARAVILQEELLFDDVCQYTTPSSIEASTYYRSYNGILGNLLYKTSEHKLKSWLYTDGTIGCNFLLYEATNVYTFVYRWLSLSLKYKFLDMVVAVTDYNDYPYTDDLHSHVKLAIWLHDGCVDVLTGDAAVQKSMEYEKLYTTEKVLAGVDEDSFNAQDNCICSKKYIVGCFNHLGANGEALYNAAVKSGVILAVAEQAQIINGTV